MPTAKKGALMDLESIAEKVVEKLMANGRFMEALSKIIRASIKEELNIVAQELEQKVSLLENTMNSRILDLEDAVDAHEQYSRINNIRIFGVPEVQNENTSDVVKKKLKGTNVVVKEDLTWKRQQLYREMQEKFDGKNCWSIDGSLFAKINNTVHKIVTGRELQSVINNISVLSLVYGSTITC